LPLARPILFTQDARSDVIAAQDWYEEQSPGLGARFTDELDLTVQRIADNALQFPVVFRDVRRALVRRFPYSLLFRIETDAVIVIAFFHASRDPQTWQGRIGN
jgi:plasmid stabilization system protein ParE